MSKFISYWLLHKWNLHSRKWQFLAQSLILTCLQVGENVLFAIENWKNCRGWKKTRIKIWYHSTRLLENVLYCTAGNFKCFSMDNSYKTLVVLHLKSSSESSWSVPNDCTKVIWWQVPSSQHTTIYSYQSRFLMPFNCSKAFIIISFIALCYYSLQRV